MQMTALTPHIHTHGIPKLGHSRQKASARPRTAANQGMFSWDPTCHPLCCSPAWIQRIAALSPSISLIPCVFFHHLHFLCVAEAFVPSISFNFNDVNFIHTVAQTHAHTIKTSKPAVAHFPQGAISEIEIVSSKKCSRCPFVFVLKHVGIARLFGMDSLHCCWAYRRSVPSVMALGVD